MHSDTGTPKSITEQWRKKAIAIPLFYIAVLSFLSIFMVAWMIAIILEDPSRRNIIFGCTMLAIFLGPMWPIVIVLLHRENSYKPSVKLIDATPGLEHNLNLAYRKAYEKETVEYGVATEYGLICQTGFAPWDAIKQITFTKTEREGKRVTTCHVRVDVKPDEKTSYVLLDFFAFDRDVSEEIEQQIERIRKFDKSVLIVNDYVFMG